MKMSSGLGMSRKRRSGYSDETIDNVRLKNSRAGYLSRVTTLRRSIEPLFSDIQNVNEVVEKILETENAFHCFEEAHYDYIATILTIPKNGKEKHGILRIKLAKRWASMRK